MINLLPWFVILALCIYGFFRQRFLFSPTAIFYMYFAAIFPVPYLVAYALDSGSFYATSPRTLNPSEVAFVLLQASLCLASFSAGRFLIPVPHIKWPTTTITPKRFPPLVIFASVLAIGGGFAVLHAIGGVSALVSDSGALRSGGLRGLGAGTYAVTAVLPTVAQFVLIYALRKRYRHTGWVLAGCLSSSLLAAVFGFRTGVFLLFIQVACIYYLMTGRTYRRLLLIGIPVLGLLVTGLGVLRIYSLGAGTKAFSQNSDQIAELIADTALTRTRAVETMILLNRYIDRSHYHYFVENIEETARVLIPSFILKKDISLSEKIGTQVYGDYLESAGIAHDVYGGVSYTLVGEAYWNLGLAGIVLESCAVGIVFALLERRLFEEAPTDTHIILYKTIAALVVPGLEAPQLAFNSLALALLLNFGILVFLCVRLQARASKTMASIA